MGSGSGWDRAEFGLGSGSGSGSRWPHEVHHTPDPKELLVERSRRLEVPLEILLGIPPDRLGTGTLGNPLLAGRAALY